MQGVLSPSHKPACVQEDEEDEEEEGEDEEGDDL